MVYVEGLQSHRAKSDEEDKKLVAMKIENSELLGITESKCSLFSEPWIFLHGIGDLLVGASAIASYSAISF